MRINVVSDLHCTLGRLEDLFIKSDITVIAGDIFDHEGTLDFIADIQDEYPDQQFIFVPGNHDFYGRTSSIATFDQMLADFKTVCQGSNVHFLYNTKFEPEGFDVEFYGGTLWTDFESLYGLGQKEVLKSWYPTNVNDCYYIKGWSVEKMLEENKKFTGGLMDFLYEHPKGPKKKVVISHFGPNPGSIHENYAEEFPWNSYWINDLKEVEDADLWIHGHVHNNFDYRVGNCRVVCNPRGYRNHKRTENPSFNQHLIVDTNAL